MKSIILLLLVAVVCAEVSLREQFSQFKKTYGKNYPTVAEHEKRFEIFRANMRLAEQRMRINPEARHGVTKFSDITPEEFKATYLMNVTFERSKLPRAPGGVAKVIPQQLPSSFDWNNQGIVTPVNNQGQCGSCWDFSATETIESVWAKAGNQLVQLSEQQILDCDTTDQGCNGGWPYDAYQYVISQGGIEPNSDYPYEAESSGQCQFNSGDVAAKISNWQYVTQSQDENAMQQYLYQNSPISVCVDAEPWQTYQGGVMTAAACGDSLDHCVQATGWSQQGGMQVWNVRNSWGADWGENGYIWLQFGQDTCGVAEVVTVPQV